MPDELIIHTPRGLYSPHADAYLDPWSPVERAIITHAHSDHATPGCGAYICSSSCEPLLRIRIGPEASIRAVPFNEPIALASARISLHPAGHILGSAQVRVEHDARVAVYTGDFKNTPDPTAELFSPIKCDHLILESTFALPIYRWQPQESVAREINQWWRDNQAGNRSSIIFAYALGKAQRVLHLLDPSIGPILVHGSVNQFRDAYQQAGVALPPAEHANEDNARSTRGRAMIVAPPSAAGSRWIRKFGPITTAFASGWMQVRGTRRRRNVDRGFVLSDHADWPGLLQTVRESGATRIDAVHGYTETLARYLREQGLDARESPRRPPSLASQGDDDD